MLPEANESSDDARAAAAAADTAGRDVYRAQAGDLVHAREALWRVTQVRAGERAVRLLSLRGEDDQNRWQQCTLLEPYDRFAPASTNASPRVVSRRRWMRAFGALVASDAGAASIAPASACGASACGASACGASASIVSMSLADANVALLPYQLEPLLAILRGVASRVLIADAVGLGKTIQAALILRELTTRGLAARVLIAVPAGLRDQWRRELRLRVGLHSDLLDATSLSARVRELPAHLNPWSRPGIVIVSLDFIKQDVVLHGLDRIVWDALIIDEAHALTTGTDRAAAAHLLAQRSRIVMLLTATPHAGSDAAFDALCQIGRLDEPHDLRRPHTSRTSRTGEDDNPIEDDAPAIFRRTRRSLGLPTTRRVRVLHVTPTPAERHLHELLERYIHRVEHEHHPGGPADPAMLAMSVLRKRASSSPWSLMRSLERRLALLQARADQDLADEQDPPPKQDQQRMRDQEHAQGQERTPNRQPGRERQPAQAALPFEEPAAASDEIDPADDEPLVWLSAPGLGSLRLERAWLSVLIQAARVACASASASASAPARQESKLRALQRLLRRVREPALVYTEYRDTLTHVGDALARGGVAVARLHGALTRKAREESLRRFAAGDARVLIATDAAGEGLNLQHRCRLVINLELPWNPNRLEQRIGRIDRLGQSRTVHAIHLVSAGTTEETVLQTLGARVSTIATALGERPDVLAVAVHPAEEDREGGGSRGNRVWPDLSRHAREAVLALERARALRAGVRRERCNPHDLLNALDRRAPWVAIIKRQARGPFAHLSRGAICIWRTRVRAMNSDAGTAYELITPLHIASRGEPSSTPWQVGEADEVKRVLDSLAESAIERRVERTRAWQERGAYRENAIEDVLYTSAAPHQPMLFADIAAEIAARQRTRWPAPAPRAAPGESPGSSLAITDVPNVSAVGAFEHALVLVLVIR